MFDGLLNVYTITGCDRVLNKLQGDKMSYFSFICFVCMKNILVNVILDLYSFIVINIQKSVKKRIL